MGEQPWREVLDGSPATLDALPEVVAGVRRRGWLRRDLRRRGSTGTDAAVKALALGADLLLLVGRRRGVSVRRRLGGGQGGGAADGGAADGDDALAGCRDVRSARNRELVQVVGETPPRSRL